MVCDSKKFGKHGINDQLKLNILFALFIHEYWLLTGQSLEHPTTKFFRTFFEVCDSDFTVPYNNVIIYSHRFGSRKPIIE